MADATTRGHRPQVVGNTVSYSVLESIHDGQRSMIWIEVETGAAPAAELIVSSAPVEGGPDQSLEARFSASQLRTLARQALNAAELLEGTRCSRRRPQA